MSSTMKRGSRVSEDMAEVETFEEFVEVFSAFASDLITLIDEHTAILARLEKNLVLIAEALRDIRLDA